jgi:hypothetical protein
MGWRDWFESLADAESYAHPGAPVGGGGRGGFRQAGPVGIEPDHTAQVPHPESPAARSFDWHTLPIIDQAERVMAVWDALQRCPQYIPGAIARATGEEVHAMLAGILPGLLLALGIMAVTTLGGAGAGAALGAFAFGAGAVPGAAAGAAAGAEAGLFILEWLGIAFLAAYIGKSLLSAAKKSTDAIKIAWNSADSRSTQEHAITVAAQELADAVADIFRGVLQGVVAFLLSKGMGAAQSRMPELVGKLKTSKLGEGFANWVERNWEGLVKNPKLNGQEVPGGGGRASPPAAAPPAPKPAPRPVEAPPPKPKPKPTKPTPKKPKPAEEEPPKPKTYKKPVKADLEKVEGNGVKPVRVIEGTNNKVAVVGRNMDAVRAEGAALREQGYDVELFDGDTIPQSAKTDWVKQTQNGTKHLSDDELLDTEMYKANQEWAEKLGNDGYSVVDIGNPNGQGASKFYQIEGQTIFGDPAPEGPPP